jgi:hypothetical protein
MATYGWKPESCQMWFLLSCIAHVGKAFGELEVD